MSPDYQDEDEPPDAVANGSLSYPQSLNHYSYVENNPLVKVDPNGHASWGPCNDDSSALCFHGDYNGERNCQSSYGCLFWNAQTQEWEKNDPTAPGSGVSDLAGWWLTGFVRATIYSDPYGLRQMGYAYAKLLLLQFGGWNLLQPPGTGHPSEAGARPSLVPGDWISKPTTKDNGTIYIDPNNPHNRVRVMDDGYMKVQKDGQCLDVNGNQVPSNSPDAHKPVDAPMKSPFADTPITDIPTPE